MKVVLVHLTGLGGTQLYNAQLANALAKEGNEVTVLLGDYLYTESHFPDAAVKVVRLPMAPSYPRMLLNMVNPLMYRRILEIILKENPMRFMLHLKILSSVRCSTYASGVEVARGLSPNMIRLSTPEKGS